MNERAWESVQRYRPHLFHEDGTNPFAGITTESPHNEGVACSRAQAYALAGAIAAWGHPLLAVEPLICFERLWHMRPENLLAGHLKWSDWRPAERPFHVRIFHAKTQMAAAAEGQAATVPELEARLRALKRVTATVVIAPSTRGSPRRYTMWYARRVVRDARRAAGLLDHLTLDACRHGGMTELGTIGLPEAYIMGLSGHQEPDAARGYDYHADAQLEEALVRRRSFV